MFQSVLYEEFLAFNGQPLDLNWGMVLLCMAVALVAGIVMAAIYRFCTRYPSRNFMATLALVPPVMTAIVPLCYGSIGVGLAMIGIFGLLRLRSAPGNARDISMVFLSAACGILCGTGFITIACITTLLGCAVVFCVSRTRSDDATERDREVRIVIPESLDYTEEFDSIIEEYTEDCRLVRVKADSTGATFELCYQLRLKEQKNEKQFIDAIRARNGHMPVIFSVILSQENSSL